MKLLKHNQVTLNQLEQFASNNQNCCVVNPCGSGKTFVMAAFIENHSDKKFVLITKQKNAADYYRQKNEIFRRADIHIVTYNKIYLDYQNEKISDYNADIYLIDEAHYANASKWKEAFSYFIKTYKPLLIGFTATPQRYEDRNTANTIISQIFDGHSAGNFSGKDLENTGVFAKVDYIPSIFDLKTITSRLIKKIEESDISEYRKDNYFAKLQNTLDNWTRTETPEHLFRQYIPNYLYKPKCNKIVVYCPNSTDITIKKKVIDKLLRKIFPKKKIKSYIYTYKTPESNLDDFLEEDKRTDIKVLYSIDKIMETIHIDDLKILIMLRPSWSDRIIVQQFGRINNTKNKNPALVLDMVSNLANLHENKQTKQISRQKTQSENSQIEKTESSANPHISFQYKHITKYANIFSMIDLSVKSPAYYTYKDFTGTAKDICFVYRKEYKEYLKLREQHNFYEAIELTPTKKLQKETVRPGFDTFLLSDQDKRVINDNIHILKNFIESHKIEDEDMAQELFIEFAYIIHRFNQNNSNTPLCRRLYVDIKRAYLRRLRTEYTKPKINITSIDKHINDACLSYTVEENNEELKTAIADVLSTLTPREEKVLRLRFGFDDGNRRTLEEIGKEFNVQRERIRQIEAKALRKLRHPSRRKKLEPFHPDN